jgi:3-carboxy-cis,cis-muconate cycloisomerase
MSDPGGGLFGAIEARGLVPEALSDAAFVRALLRFEAALAAAEADAGQVPAAHAEAIVALALGPAPDPASLGGAASASGAPVVPLLEAMRSRLDADARDSLHRGSTTQDAVDSAVMLLAAGAIGVVVADLEAAAGAAARLAEAHRTTPAVGRTLLQRARPTTFGARSAGWLAGLDEAVDRLEWVRSERLAVQLGGPVGTMEALGSAAPEVVRGVAGRLHLAAPVLPWHAERSRIVDLAGALGLASAAAGSVALDLVLLAQTDVGEVADARPERGGSSSMPNKRNPIAAVLARAAAAQAPGLVATLIVAATGGELERAAGAWHAEWRALRALLVSTGSAAAWLRDSLEHLAVDTERMARNLAADGQAEPAPEATVAGERVADAGLARHAARIGRTTTRPARLHVVVDGPQDAPLVVLASSLGSTLAMWDPIVPALARSLRVARYDLRGHGASSTPPGPYSMAELGGDLVSVIEEIGAKRAHVVGTSIGGMAAMWAAAYRPERIDRLVLIGTSALLGPPENWIARARTVLGEGTAAVAEQVTARWITPSYAAAKPSVLEDLRAMFDRADPAGYAGCCLAIAAMDLRDDLGRITAPTLVLAGADDPATPPEHAEAIASAVAEARLERIPDAAHLPSVEQPEAVARLILDHLDGEERR